MATLPVVNLSNQAVGDAEFDDKIVQSALNPFIIKDTVVAELAGKRQGTHKAKCRAEVAGSRKKLFKQKGTGGARAGSRQSPIRRHGGVVFGPVPRSHNVGINKKVKKAALASVIAEKIRNNEFIVVENLSLEDHKTKNLVTVLRGLNLESVLAVGVDSQKNFELASNNLKSVKFIHVSGLNTFDVLRHKKLLVTKDALKKIEERLIL